MGLRIAVHPDVGARTARLQEEGIVIVEEVHAVGSELVDGSHLAAQRGTHTLLELLRIVGHHLLRLFQREAHGIVTASPRVVERRLVGTQVNVDVLLSQALPEVNHIAYVGHRDDTLLCHSLLDSGNQLVEVLVQLVHPALLVALAGSQGIDFGRHAHHTGNVASLGLSARHAAKTCRDEELHVVATHLAGSIEHGDGGAVNDALRPNIHI